MMVLGRERERRVAMVDFPEPGMPDIWMKKFGGECIVLGGMVV